MASRLTLLFAACVPLLLASCGETSEAERWLTRRPAVVAVSGLVEHDGAPLADAVVTFYPVDGRYSAFGRTDASGRYRLTTFSDGDGAVPGAYRIGVDKTVVEHLPDPKNPAVLPPLYQVEYQRVPDRYTKKETSGLAATVARAGEEFAFQLSGPADRRAAVVADKVRPNVIFILADDLGYGDLGCFGQRHIETPNIDRLAAEGMRFTQAYAGATVCAPSRCSLMTGLHNGHAPIRGNKELPGEGQTPMPADTFTIAHLLQRAGYRTGLVGKWGLGHPGSVSTPTKMGFDEFFGYNCQRQAHEYYPEYLWRNDEKVPLGGKSYSHDLLAEEALAFVRRSKDKPFFLDLSFTIPHSKLQVPDLGPYADRGWTDDEKKVASMITRMDRDVGRLMELLKELKIDERTLVFFASDNGAAHRHPRFDHSGPLRGFKRAMYEGGLRSPSIARWPGRIPAGVVSEQVWSFADVMPTLAELARQELTANTDGISIVPALIHGRVVEHPPLYWEFHEKGFFQAARIGDWKGVRTGLRGKLELYDLAGDLGEKHDVAADHPDVVRRIEAFLDGARVESAEWPVNEKAARNRN